LDIFYFINQGFPDEIKEINGKIVKRRITNGNCIAAFGGSASVRLGHSAALHSHASLQHSLAALVFAAQSPYPGCQTVSYLKRYAKWRLN
jgi:hypothetical protein